MAKYRKKPVVVEAVQWFKMGDVDCVESIVPRLTMPVLIQECKNCGQVIGEVHGWVDTLEGGHIVCPSDYIITGIQNERYPCKKDIFEQSYDKVEG